MQAKEKRCGQQASCPSLSYLRSERDFIKTIRKSKYARSLVINRKVQRPRQRPLGLRALAVLPTLQHVNRLCVQGDPFTIGGKRGAEIEASTDAIGNVPPFRVKN